MHALPKNLQAFPKPQSASQPDWQLQDAKNRFSQVVRAAQAGVPQWVTVHGKRAVVVLSAQEFAQMSPAPGLTPIKPSLLEDLLNPGLLYRWGGGLVGLHQLGKSQNGIQRRA